MMVSNSSSAGIRGISVVEVLIALAVLAVIGAIFLPSPEKDSAKADMQVAEENLQQAVYLARSTAINKQTEVIMHLVPGSTTEPGKISFSFASEQAELLAGTEAGTDTGVLDREYVFPAEIRLETAANEVFFDATGEVESPARIELISSRNVDFHQRLLIQ